MKKIFVNLDSKIKLTSIVYNKKIQKKLGLNLIDFKRFSGRYRKEENGITREYNSYNHNLLFEGNYSNRKRNGKGKEYNEQENIIFEGEYLEGKNCLY